MPITRYKPSIRSRHPSHSVLRKKGALPRFKFRSVIRFGSTTELSKKYTVEINTVDAITNSSSKLKMKHCFDQHNVITADWWKAIKSGETYTFKKSEDNNQTCSIDELSYPIISKAIFGSRGRGNKKHNSADELRSWLNGKNLSKYIFERFYNYAREYRLHVTKEGCFYTCRKLMKRDTPDKDKWFKNDSNCVWALETNPNFDRPVNWSDIEKQCVKALNAVGLDFGAVDLRVQSSTDANGNTRSNPEFIIVEINSAPSFGTVTEEKYKTLLKRLIIRKYNEIRN